MFSHQCLGISEGRWVVSEANVNVQEVSIHDNDGTCPNLIETKGTDVLRTV